MISDQVSSQTASTFAQMGGRRLLIFGGIALIAGGMFLGDIFAVFVLHQNGGETGRTLLLASQAAAAGNAENVKTDLASIGSLLEDHGTKVDAHVHMTDAGYLALLLALLQPYVAISQKHKKQLAWLFVISGFLLPLGIFLIHYVGLAYSPFSVIGWASILADSAGALLIVVLVIEFCGLWKHVRSSNTTTEPELPNDRSWERSVLLSGGTALVLLGFLYGAWYAGADLYEHEARENRIFQSILSSTQSGSVESSQITDYGSLATEKAVRIAAHSHIIEFGILAILLSFIQPFVYLRDGWKRRWILLLLAGSLILPIFVLLELKLGLLAGGIADVGGLMVLIALIGMLVGILRYAGVLDSQGLGS